MVRKIDMSSFRKSQEEKSGRDESIANGGGERAIRTESKEASPMLSGNAKIGQTIRKTERKSIRLPISGADIELTSTEVVPSDCLIHPRNQRVQSLLKLENPKVASLKAAIESEKQREPVLARWITVDGVKTLEILDGSRRRFVGDLIHNEDPDFRLRAWVGAISDTDADYLAKAGNDDRDDISPWEVAQSLKSIERDHPTWSHEVIAANEKMSRTAVTNLLTIADIPIEVVGLLESPDLLKINSGLQVAKMLKHSSDKRYVNELTTNAPYKKFSDLANKLKEILKPKSKTEMPSANRKVEIKNGKKVRAAIGMNRAVKGQYKIDLFELTDSEYESVVSFLEKTLR